MEILQIANLILTGGAFLSIIHLAFKYGEFEGTTKTEIREHARRIDRLEDK